MSASYNYHLFPEVIKLNNINVSELQARIDKGDIRLVDVRTEAETARGFIHGAVKLPLNLLQLRLQELDSTAPTVFYCQMGGRSAQAATFATAQGFTEVYNLQGGIAAWMQAGQPVSQ